jgi:hypothetical protein
MKNYKVELTDKNGNVLLTHNLFAKSCEDAESKCKVLVENARDSRVANFKLTN